MTKIPAPYTLIGDYAVGYYGYPRATNDMDVWVVLYSENAERVTAALKSFGCDTPELSPNLLRIYPTLHVAG